MKDAQPDFFDPSPNQARSQPKPKSHDVGLPPPGQSGSDVSTNKDKPSSVDAYGLKRERETAAQLEILARRRLIGYVLGTVAIIGAVVFFVWSLKALDSLKGPLHPTQERFALAKLAAHSVISVAFIIFLYYVVRISERMVLPTWWNPSLRKTMLGAQDPITNVKKIISIMTGSLNETLGEFLDRLPKGKPGKKE